MIILKTQHAILKSLTTLALLAILPGASLLTYGVRVGHAAGEESTFLRLTPPAPIFDDKERQAELAQRRARVAQKIGPKAVLILFSAEPKLYSNDVSYEYRQENNLYYLTSLKQNRATLAMLPGNKQTPEILFLPRRSPFVERWNGRMYSPEDAARVSGIREIWDASEFEPFVRALRARQPYRPKVDNILMSGALSALDVEASAGLESLFAAAEANEAELHMLSDEPANREYGREQLFVSDWVKNATGYKVRDASPIFADMRLRKSPMELRLLQHAIDITSEAQQRAWLAARDSKWEYEVHAQVIFTFKLRNADYWGYPSIVGCGPNATTLHYTESQGKVAPGDLILMDVGAEYEHYTADVTRTFPVNGKFSPLQAEVYQIVYDAQEAAAKAIRPGAMYSDVHRAATRVIKDGLFKLGLITDRDSFQYFLWFPHSTTHWLGMNVHDVGFAAKLEPGMVFTNEPGIYVRPDALDYRPDRVNQEEWEKFKAAVRPAFEKYRGIGVRIEDDMLVTEEGVRWMTEALPRKISDIEAFIARDRK